MHAGRLRDQITVMNSVPVRTPSGDVKPEWQEGKTVWAEVKGISGREIISASAEKAEATVRVWGREGDREEMADEKGDAVAPLDDPPEGRSEGVLAGEIAAEIRAIRTGVLPSFYLSFTLDEFQA